jgi:hypothetical protein
MLPGRDTLPRACRKALTMARSGERDWVSGRLSPRCCRRSRIRCLEASNPETLAISDPIRCTKEPYQQVMWAIRERICGQQGVWEHPNHLTKACGSLSRDCSGRVHRCAQRAAATQGCATTDTEILPTVSRYSSEPSRNCEVSGLRQVSSPQLPSKKRRMGKTTR